MPAASEMSSRARPPSSAPVPKLRIAIGTTATTASVAMLEYSRFSNLRLVRLRPRWRMVGARPAIPPSSRALPRIDPGDRDAHDVGEIGAEREQRQRELRDVAERGLDDAELRRRQPAPEVVAADRDDGRDEDQRKRAGVGPRGLAEREVDDARGRCQHQRGREHQPFALHQTPSPLSVATRASAIARIGRPGAL